MGKQKNSNKTGTYIVDSHNKVLSAWAYYRSTLQAPPRLITLDHHTDTSRPFRRLVAQTHSKTISELKFQEIQNSYLKLIDFTDSQSIEDAISNLNNDEHIVTAIKSQIISSAFVIAHNADTTNLEIYKEHRIACHSVDEIHSDNKPSRPNYDDVLESSFLEQAVKTFNKILELNNEEPLLRRPYILDIDLDYFNTYRSIEPEDSDTFIALAMNAGLITIATEPEYVKTCAVDPGLTSPYLLERLQKLLPSST